MDIALCTLDNTTYSSYSFSKLSSPEISQKRQFLICPECHGPAYFRKKSTNGRAACFGARPHNSDCQYATLDENRVVAGQEEAAEIINNPAERIVVDLNFGPREHVHAVPDENNPLQGNGIAGMHVGDYAQNNARAQRRLSTLLRTLIEVPDFRKSQQTLEIFDEEYPVRNFFVPFLEIINEHTGSIKGFWGMLSDARFDGENTVWLNSGGQGNISFCLSEELFLELRARYRVTDDEDFAGAYALILGKVNVSNKGKKWCKVDDLGMISLRFR